MTVSIIFVSMFSLVKTLSGQKSSVSLFFTIGKVANNPRLVELLIIFKGKSIQMTQDKRNLSIDIMRRLTLFLMLFVNYSDVPGVPQRLSHVGKGIDGMGLAD